MLPEDKNKPKQFYLEFNTPCPLCSLSSFPVSNQDEVRDMISHKYKILTKAKIDISEDEVSANRYSLENDRFQITLNKDENLRHRLVDLIHELSHVILEMESFKKNIDIIGKGSYFREKKTLELELKITKDLFPLLYKVLYSEFLNLFRRVLFEIELYKNPYQDLSKLYTEVSNLCFKKAEQKENSTYLIDENILSRPLAALPHAVACTQVVLNLGISKDK